MNQNSSNEKCVRLRDRFREETGLAILAAAEGVFSEEGLHGARMEAIAARAGVAVGTVYNHFEDREALVEALSCSRRGMLFDRIDAAIAACSGTPVRDQLRALFAAFGEHAAVHGKFLTVLVQSGDGPARWKPRNEIQDGMMERVGTLVDRCIARGELRPDGREVYALALVSVVRIALIRVLEGQGNWDALAEAIVDLFLRGART
jgi:AcrR family transcriptional regulator